ncbi:hypothetical protein ACFRAU_07580 [Arthrobacter sp. NPDC056691]|uniref:hypothetical protein n=1 Tax=Arthrobacter sp. NPDC056691 TaxID=3345913 RepID=UPI00366EF4EC
MNSNPHHTKMTLCCVTDWRRAPGEIVEIHAGGELLRRGEVDEVMPNGTGFWLLADGAHLRTYIDKAEGFELWAAHPIQNP